MSKFRGITIRICGGLGNQLFEYAYAYNVAKRLSVPLRLDVSNYYEGSYRNYALNKFCLDEHQKIRMSINGGLINKIFRRMKIGVFTSIFRESDIVQTDKNFSTPPSESYLLGVFANYSYFVDSEEEIRRQYSPCVELTENAQKWKEVIQSMGNVVSVHIRRGDYVQVNRSTLAMDYFENAIIRMKELRGEGTKFLFFCEDIAWVEKWFGKREGYFYLKDDTLSDFDEFLLMQECNANIVADSTFSWWAAFLNSHDDKQVIIPDSEVNYPLISPREWISIPAHTINVDEKPEYA